MERPETVGRTETAGRMPALDGIRAFAVLAVITYHTGVPWMRGGYYGVDVFLVLSGFLITSLLVGEWGQRGAIALGGFWVRRARRLLPALFLMLAGVALVAGLWPAVLSAPHLMSDSLATIFYVANWHLAGEHASYFAAVNQPSPLLHTWTLAIEEQFYLLWPLVVVAVMRGGRRRAGRSGNPGGGPVDATRRLRRLFTVACAGALASAVWMIVLAPTDGSDPSRAYYGSDTRAQGLLVGAALALGCALWGPVRTRRGVRVTGTVGLAGAAGVALMWIFVPETSALAFHGGFLLVTLACAALVAAAARVPRSAVGTVLALPPLRYLGRISYGMYLWYWPVLLVMNGGRTHLHGYTLTVARLTVVTALAALSFHLVETPVRRGSLAGWRGLIAAPAAAAAAAGAMLAATTLPALGTSVLTTAAGASGPAAASSAVSVLAAASSPAPGSGGSPSTGSSPTGAFSAPAQPQPAGAAPAGSATGRASGAGSSRHPSSSGSGSGQASSGPGGSPGTARPVRILLVGDSMAGSLGVGLADAAPRFGAEVVNQGMPGCSLGSDQQDRVLWYTLPPGHPCVAGQPGALLSAWADLVARTSPDVVVYLARTDLLDQQHGGQWQHVGQDGYDSWLAGRLAAALPVLGSGGARVVLLTSPSYQTGEQSSGDIWPEDDPARLKADTALLRAVPGATVVDAGSLLTPDDTYRSSAGDVALRCSDGVHLTRSGGQWLGARILPQLVALGRAHASLPASASRAPAPPAIPSWWSKLPCDI